MNQEQDSAIVKATETSLGIIEALREMETAQTEAIADRLGVSTSTAHRHLKTLKKYGYVINEGGSYKLGLQFLTVGGGLRKRRGEFKLVRESIEELADQTQERVQFEVEEQGERVFLHTAIGDRAVQAHGAIGKRGPLHTSAAGKAMLAEMTDQRVEQIIKEKGLVQKTEYTITDSDELFEELEEIRETGIAFNREESNLGIRAVGSCITHQSGNLIGAISVSGPAHRLSGGLFHDELPNTVRGITQELELNIQYWE